MNNNIALTAQIRSAASAAGKRRKDKESHCQSQSAVSEDGVVSRPYVSRQLTQTISQRPLADNHASQPDGRQWRPCQSAIEYLREVLGVR